MSQRLRWLAWLAVFMAATFAFGLLTNLSGWRAGGLAVALAVALLGLDILWHLLKHVRQERRR